MCRSEFGRRRIEIMKQYSSFLTWRFDAALQFASGLSAPPKEDQLWYYGASVETLRQTAAPKEPVDELQRVVKEVKIVSEMTSVP